MRSPHASGRTAPASVPSARRETPPSTRTSTVPSRNVPSPRPPAAVTSETSDEPSARGAPRGEDRLGREVHAVRDQLHDHVRPGKRGPGDAGVAVPERPHRVEEMRDRARALVEGGVGDHRGGVGVAERDDDAAVDERVDELARPR